MSDKIDDEALPEDWWLEQQAFDASNHSDVPEWAQEAVQNIWKAYCMMEQERDALRSHNAMMREALDNFVTEYVEMVNSGDCGFWDPEKETKVIAARQALSFQSPKEETP